jgi:hypothetical protein
LAFLAGGAAAVGKSKLYLPPPSWNGNDAMVVLPPNQDGWSPVATPSGPVTLPPDRNSYSPNDIMGQSPQVTIGRRTILGGA